MPATVTIEGKVLGRRTPVLAGWELELPDEWQDPAERLSLRDFISRVVLEEVAAFRRRQLQQRLIRVLSPDAIARGAQRGKVALGGRDLDQKVDPPSAVETALQAFQDRIYFVFVDGQQKVALDEVVELRPDSRVTFLRLVPLAGG
jgi:hypothetical protein